MSSSTSAEPARPTQRASLDALLEYAWDQVVFTSNDAMPAVGLTRSTTIDAIDTLVATGLLVELPNARVAGEYRKGRPSRRFTLRADAGVVIGLDVGQGHITVVVADLRGAALHRLRSDFDTLEESAEGRRATIDASIRSALASSGHVRADVVAACAGVAAPVNRLGASPPHRDRFWERMNPDVSGILAAWADVARVENDASLAAVAEGTTGAAQGCSDYVALLAGARLGAGVVVDGHLLRGAHGGVGEMVGFDHVEGVNGAYGLGHRAAEWARDAIVRGQVNPKGKLTALSPEDLDGRHVLELAAAGDPDALRVADRVGGMLARVVSVLGSMYDPSRVIVCGAITAGLSTVVDAARRALPEELDLPAPELLVSALGTDVVVTGAVREALRLARTSALDRWMS